MNDPVRKLDKILKDALKRSTDRQLLVGPTVWQPSDGTAGKLWYFIFVVGDKARQFYCGQISAPDKDTADTTRQAFILIAVQQRPLVIHDMGDELQMAKMCEALWPGKRSTKIRQSLEAENRN